MGRRNQHSREEQQEMALAAAELILVREGLTGLSMRKVAQAIGYTVGQLYLLFQNQDDLLSSINERTADAMYAQLRDTIEPLPEPRARLQAMAAAYIEYAQHHPHRWRLLFEHQLPEAMLPRPSVDLRLKRLFELVETSLAPLLPRADAPRLRRAAAALWSGVHGVCVLSVTGKLKWSGLTDYRPLCQEVIDTFLAGVSRPSSAPHSRQNPPRRSRA